MLLENTNIPRVRTRIYVEHLNIYARARTFQTVLHAALFPIVSVRLTVNRITAHRRISAPLTTAPWVSRYRKIAPNRTVGFTTSENRTEPPRRIYDF